MVLDLTNILLDAGELTVQPHQRPGTRVRRAAGHGWRCRRGSLGWAAERVERAVRAAEKAEAAARAANSAYDESKKALNRAFWLLIRVYQQRYGEVRRAREKLDQAKRRVRWIFIGRRAARVAWHHLQEAETALQAEHDAISAWSDRLARLIEAFVAAELDGRHRALAHEHKAAQAKAERGYAAIPIPHERQLRLSYFVDRQDARCGICGGSLRGFMDDELHIDHILPRSKGGSDDPANLQVTHKACNIKKGATWPWPPEGFDPQKFQPQEVQKRLFGLQE